MYAFLRYEKAYEERHAAENAYRLYVAESIRLRGEGMYISASLPEMLNPPPDYDAEEVVESVLERI